MLSRKYVYERIVGRNDFSVRETTIRRITMPKTWKNDEISEEKQIAWFSYRLLREKKQCFLITRLFILFRFSFTSSSFVFSA